jgi:hypothetical protein
VTFSAAAVNRASISPAPAGAQNDGRYIPGVCNIGPSEIARRRRTGHFGLIVSVMVLAALILVDASAPLRLLVFFPAALSASGYLQAHLKFCAGFGQLGVFNCGERGSTVHVDDKAARAKDRMKAWQIGIASGLIGLAVAAMAVLLPV